jgi:hypothetical protein
MKNPAKKRQRPQISKRANAPITAIRLNPNQSPVSVADLALMLRIDLMLGRQRKFETRLQQALDAAASTS